MVLFFAKLDNDRVDLLCKLGAAPEAHPDCTPRIVYLMNKWMAHWKRITVPRQHPWHRFEVVI